MWKLLAQGLGQPLGGCQIPEVYVLGDRVGKDCPLTHASKTDFLLGRPWPLEQFLMKS